MESKTAFDKARSEAREMEIPEITRQAQAFIQEIDSIRNSGEKENKGFFKNTFKEISSTVDKTTTDLGVTATLKIARFQEKKGNYGKAIEQYTKAMNQLEGRGKQVEVFQLQEHIAELLDKKGNYFKAIGALSTLQQEMKQNGDAVAVERLQKKIDQINGKVTAVVERNLKTGSGTFRYAQR